MTASNDQRDPAISTEPDGFAKSAEQREGTAFLLESPQIEVALAEIRFAPLQREISVDDALAIRAALRAAGTNLESVQPAAAQELSLAVTPAGVQSSTIAQASGWQISDTAHRTVVTVLPAAVSVQTSEYERWSVTLRPVLESLLAAVAEVLAPELRTRVGLRYVNRFANPEARTAGHWCDRIDSDLLGPLRSRDFADRVIGSQQQMDLADAPGRGRTLRHGCFQDAVVRGAFSYLLDIDAFDTTTERFEPDDVIAVVTELNRVAAATFRGALSEAYAAELGLTEVEAIEHGTGDEGSIGASDGGDEA